AVALGISYEDHFWRHLCSVTGLSDLAGHSREERMQQRIMIRERLASALAVQPVQHWVDGFGDVVPCSPVRRLADVIEDDHIRSRGLVVVADDEHGHPFRTVVSPFARRPAGAQRSPRRVPSLGCDNESVGLAKADVPALCEG
ncbi:MAG: CoA transferase, partial [Acidimicrobiales bacterium]